MTNPTEPRKEVDVLKEMMKDYSAHGLYWESPEGKPAWFPRIIAILERLESRLEAVERELATQE